eukprot:GHVQ01030123.1.p1 GENE.GHVQ01030123.1~~GHVQ01030123.1.p1  ORF type:complete len:363 (-),score=59.67 GHVQ01030123.1:923-2011(-)
MMNTYIKLYPIFFFLFGITILSHSIYPSYTHKHTHPHTHPHTHSSIPIGLILAEAAVDPPNNSLDSTKRDESTTAVGCTKVHPKVVPPIPPYTICHGAIHQTSEPTENVIPTFSHVRVSLGDSTAATTACLNAGSRLPPPIDLKHVEKSLSRREGGSMSREERSEDVSNPCGANVRMFRIAQETMFLKGQTQEETEHIKRELQELDSDFRSLEIHVETPPVSEYAKILNSYPAVGGTLNADFYKYLGIQPVKPCSAAYTFPPIDGAFLRKLLTLLLLDFIYRTKKNEGNQHFKRPTIFSLVGGSNKPVLDVTKSNKMAMYWILDNLSDQPQLLHPRLVVRLRSGLEITVCTIPMFFKQQLKK